MEALWKQKISTLRLYTHPALPAQIRKLMHKPHQMFSFPAPDVPPPNSSHSVRMLLAFESALEHILLLERADDTLHHTDDRGKVRRDELSPQAVPPKTYHNSSF